MADFSFSFDSDNPFADPAQTPKKAPASPDETLTAPDDSNGEAPVAPAVATDEATPDESAPDEFTLDAFDFAFDEGASVNDSLPIQTEPSSEATSRQLTPGEAEFAEFDFDAFEGETEPQPETPAEPEEASIAVLPESSAKSTPSDLEEFNALAFDLDTPADVMFASETANEEAEATFAEPASFVEESIFTEPVAELEQSAEPVSEMSVPDAVAAAATLPDVAASETQAKTEVRRLKTNSLLSVAILGASGIGKNHARWFHRHGCRVAAFLGTSADSTAQTETDLNAEFDFQGNAYTDLGELLANEKPDIVCVATPPPLHFGHVLQSLEAGAHVLCEKPLVYAPTRKFRENRDGAKELVKVAAKRKLNLGTQLQYGAATPILCKLAGLAPTDIGDFAMELETLNPNSPRDPRELWIDLGPHPVSVAQMLAGPNAQLAEETIRFEPHQNDEKTEVLARFGINCADGRLLMVRAVVRALRGETTRKPRRRFSFNGHAIIYAPLQSKNNGFQAQFIAPDGYSNVYSDPVDYLIGDFVSACRNGKAPLISGDFGRENLEWMLKIGMPAETR